MLHVSALTGKYRLKISATRKPFAMSLRAGYVRGWGTGCRDLGAGVQDVEASHASGVSEPRWATPALPVTYCASGLSERRRVTVLALGSLKRPHASPSHVLEGVGEVQALYPLVDITVQGWQVRGALIPKQSVVWWPLPSAW